MGLKNKDGRADMYAKARRVLEEGITFTDAERLADVERRFQALKARRQQQIDDAVRLAPTMGAAKRAANRIAGLYREELWELDRERRSLKTPPTTS